MIALGVFAFILFFASDYNDLKLRKRGLALLFPSGALILAFSTYMQCDLSRALVTSTPAVICVCVLFILFLALEIYTLFFALPLSDSYASPGDSRCVCTKGVYSLCRHPGVLWFIGAYICLWLVAGLQLAATALYSLLNIALIIYEDLLVFPRVLNDYDKYKKTTPFLFPNVFRSVLLIRKQ